MTNLSSGCLGAIQSLTPRHDLQVGTKASVEQLMGMLRHAAKEASPQAKAQLLAEVTGAMRNALGLTGKETA